MNNLLSVSPVVLDVAFFVILFVGILLGVISGFIKCVFKWAGSILSVFLAFTFCNAFQGTLNGWFGLTDALVNAFNNLNISAEMAQKIAGWIALAISFVIILVGAKLICWLIGKIGTALTDKVKVFKVINKTLGGVLGLAEAFVLILFALIICQWINSEAVNQFISASTIVGKLYNSEWLVWASTLPFIPKISK